ncbi:hypothetical protein F383_19835 [Gossypium arboreum]|uniref:Uncharacterized protein n=1 Tax=Gossypium arboreum TaxID=29729 RepID=A0A0B0NKN1_GOSAR|nr:hypothetical protein F383_19835 [Gossypium arboreum]
MACVGWIIFFEMFYFGFCII